MLCPSCNNKKKYAKKRIHILKSLVQSFQTNTPRNGRTYSHIMNSIGPSFSAYLSSPPLTQYCKNFQFKFLYRILYINIQLFKFKYIDSPMCTFCHATEETILYLFYECKRTKTFWNEVGNPCHFPLIPLSIFF